MKKTIRVLMLLIVATLMATEIIVTVSISAYEDVGLNISLEDTESFDVAENETESFLYEEILSEEMQIKENAAVEKYNQLLETWSYDKTNISDVDADFPGFYGGIYINDEKDLIIQVTVNDEDVINYFEQLIDLTDVEFEEVEYSFEQLKEVHDSLEEYIFSSTGSEKTVDVSAVGLSMQDNSVMLYVVDVANEEELIYTELGINEDYLDTDMIQVISVSGYDVDTGSTVSLGSSIKSSSGYSRSVGFWAYDSDGNLGIVTAGHNVSKGETFSIYGGQIFGTSDTPYIKNAVDAVFIKRVNSALYASRISVSNKITIKSNTYAYLPTGATTYSYGYASGYKTGEVLDNFYSGETDEEVKYSNMTVTSATSISGDSGGIVAGAGTSSARFLAGIIKGHQNNTGYQIYSKANYIIANLDVTVY